MTLETLNARIREIPLSDLSDAAKALAARAHDALAALPRNLDTLAGMDELSSRGLLSPL